MSDQTGPLRLYEPAECGKDGYPLAWHSIDGGPGVKHLVREQAGHRCVRCGHPYRNGEHGNGEWSACDERCTHEGPFRIRFYSGGDHREPDALDLDWHDTTGRFAPDPSVVEARWRILTVHHLTGCWGREKEAKRDLRWWNLVAVCQRCHLTLQRKVDMHRVYPWPHSDWFKPYAAGWYAWAYLGENLSRPDVEARLDELLALELVAGSGC